MIFSFIEQTCAWRDPEFRVEFLKLFEKDATTPETRARYNALLALNELLLTSEDNVHYSNKVING